MLVAAKTHTTGSFGYTALHRCFSAEEANAILNLGLIDVNVKNDQGMTPLNMAVMNETLEVAEVLLKRGADVNVKDKNKCSPLHNACILRYEKFTSRDEAFVGLLLEHNADINARTVLGNTPLHYASQYGTTRMVELLIGAGADLNSKNNYGCTPFDVCHNYEMKKLLAPKAEYVVPVNKDRDDIQPLLDVVDRAHSLLKTAKEQATGVDADTDLANTLYQTALELLKTAIC